MPKTRKRVMQSGAKSISVRIKNKIGGRKSTKSAGTMPNPELEKALTTCRKRDRNKLRRAFEARGLASA